MRISSYLFPLIPFCTLVGSFFVFGIGIILVLASYSEASADEHSKDVQPYGIDRRIPWETSRVVGVPDATDNLSTVAREPGRFVEAGKSNLQRKRLVLLLSHTQFLPHRRAEGLISPILGWVLQRESRVWGRRRI